MKRHPITRHAAHETWQLAFCLGALEPWRSGPGGGGYMLVYLAGERRAYCVDFGMVAGSAVDPTAYALVPGADADLFGWPAVIEDRNVHGPLSMMVPPVIKTS